MTGTLLAVPQPRGEIAPADRERLLAARTARDQADEAYKTAVADALKHGGSVREVCRLTGLAMQTVLDWGHARGWPTDAQRERRAFMQPKRSGPSST